MPNTSRGSNSRNEQTFCIGGPLNDCWMCNKSQAQFVWFSTIIPQCCQMTVRSCLRRPMTSGYKISRFLNRWICTILAVVVQEAVTSKLKWSVGRMQLTDRSLSITEGTGGSASCQKVINTIQSNCGMSMILVSPTNVENYLLTRQLSNNCNKCMKVSIYNQRHRTRVHCINIMGKIARKSSHVL